MYMGKEFKAFGFFSIIITYLAIIVTNDVNFVRSGPITDSSTNDLSNASNSTKNTINHFKDLKLCEIQDTSRIIKSTCDLTALNFTFFAFFKPKRSLKFKNLQELAMTLSNHSKCEVRYMKYNYWSESLEYFEPTDDYYWYEGKVLNNSYKADVYIISNKKQKGRKTIIFQCKLPKSDVYLSIKPMISKTIHSYPIPPKYVTVSGFHVKLNFLPLAGIQVNLKKKQQLPEPAYKKFLPTTTTTTTTTKRYIYTEFYKSDRIATKENVIAEKIEEIKEEEDTSESSIDSDMVSVQRFMVFYDGKCRNCMFNVMNSTLDSNLLVDPTFYHSIKCHLKARSCVYEGKCYLENEANTYYEKTSFKCDTKSNQISAFPIPLDKPCSKNNGNCDIHQKCEFDEQNNKVLCISSIHY